MRTSRGAAAALIIGVVLSGCASTTDDEPPAEQVAEAPVNPWDLPLEERPDLFDPCTEIPVEAIEEALGGHVEPIDLYTRQQEGALMVCGWATEEVDLTVLSTWKSRAEYLVDPSLELLDANSATRTRSGITAIDSADNSIRGCTSIFFTSRGTVWIRLIPASSPLTNPLKSPVESCGSLNQASETLVDHLPEGDF